MHPLINQFSNMDRQTPYSGCYRQQNQDPNIINKKADLKLVELKKMIGDTPFKQKPVIIQEFLPQLDYKTRQKNINIKINNSSINISDSNAKMHSFRKQKINVDVRFIQKKTESHKNLPNRSESKTYHYESDYGSQQQFYFDKKRPQQVIEAQLQKLNRRKQFSRMHTENSRKYNYQNEKLQSIVEKKINQDKQRNPTKYIVLAREAGLQDKQIFKMKPAHLNFQLQRCKKNIGLEYLYDNRLRMKARSNSKLKRYSTQPDDALSHLNPQKKKYINYIPQVFGNLKPKSKKTVIVDTNSENQIQPKPLVYIDPKLSKLNALSAKQEKIAKQILSKVKKHFKEQKQTRPNYFQVVKSEQAIDEKLIQFLRAKINRAQAALT